MTIPPARQKSIESMMDLILTFYGVKEVVFDNHVGIFENLKAFYRCFRNTVISVVKSIS